MFTFRGKTLSKLFRTAERNAKWLGKLHKNCSKKLAKVGKFLTLHPASAKPPKEGSGNKLTLLYIGEAKNYNDFAATDLPKLTKALDGTATYADGKLTMTGIAFARIVADVTIEFNFEEEERKEAA